MKEIWKQVKDFPMYDVSNKGQVRSRQMGYLHLLKPGLGSNGYLSVVLSHNLKPSTKNIHSLVLETFISSCPNGFIANHKNGIKINNYVYNLEWVTYSQNLEHAIKKGLKNPPPNIGEANGNSKLKNGDVWLIKKLLWFEVSHRAIAKMFLIAKSTITYINLEITWSHIKFEPTEKDRAIYRKRQNL